MRQGYLEEVQKDAFQKQPTQSRKTPLILLFRNSADTNNSSTGNGTDDTLDSTTDNNPDTETQEETTQNSDQNSSNTDPEWVSWRADALPNVNFDSDAPEQGYSVDLLSNAGNRTLHFNNDQGRFDGREVTFPFEVIARNIGIEDIHNPGQVPASSNNTYIFAGVQIHVVDSEIPTSSHVVVGHRGSHSSTVEGKNTVNGSSSVDDAGANILPNARADLRIVGNADRTLTVYWQVPNTSGNTANDHWELYRGNGTLLGNAPNFGPSVYAGIITYAYFDAGVPFRGAADSFEIIELDQYY